MAGFDAATALGKLPWKFSTGDSGVVPEPSTDQVGEFFDQLHTILRRPEDAQGKVPDNKMPDFLERMSADQRMFADEKVIAAHAAVCGDCPSASQIAAVPHRERVKFFEWIVSELVDPT